MRSHCFTNVFIVFVIAIVVVAQVHFAASALRHGVRVASSQVVTIVVVAELTECPSTRREPRDAIDVVYIGAEHIECLSTLFVLAHCVVEELICRIEHFAVTLPLR